MASDVPFCSLCEQRHMLISAEVWCPECEEALCGNCYQNHCLSRTLKKHETIPISKYVELPSFVHEIKQYCGNHGEQFLTYCKVHECPCCFKCTLGNHSTCKDSVALDEVIHNAKTSNAFTEIEQILDELASNIKEIKDDRKQNIQTLVTEKMKIKTEIENMKQSIVEHLDKLEEDIIKRLNDVEKWQLTEINQFVDKLSVKERNIANNQELLSKVKDHGSNLQAFLVTKRMVSEVDECEKSLKSLVENNNLKTKHLTFNLETNVSDFLSKFQVQIHVEESPCKVGLARKKEKQAQLLLPITARTFADDITLYLHNRILTNGRDIRGLTLFPNGRLVYADQHFTKDKVVCINNNGITKWKLDLPHDAFDIELIEESKVAVSSGMSNQMKVSVIDLQTRLITKTYDCPSRVYGISAMKGKLVCSCRQSGILVINLSNGLLTKINSPTGEISSYSYIKLFGANIYYTDFDKSIVVCCDLKGKKMWEFKDETILRCPSGIDVDMNGFVYVVGKETCNVVVISTNGRQCRQLLTKEDGLERPHAIVYDKETSKMLIANGSKTIFSYSFRS